MPSQLETAKAALGTIAGKCLGRKGTSATARVDANKVKSMVAGIESGCRADIAALASILANSNANDAHQAAAKMGQAAEKGREVMNHLGNAVKALTELDGLLDIAHEATKQTQTMI
jgi:hypothetical protein